MNLYQLIVGFDEFNPFKGFPTGIAHKTLEGAWEEVGNILEEYFLEYYLKTLEFKDIDVDVTNRYIVIRYDRIGIFKADAVITIKIEGLFVID